MKKVFGVVGLMAVTLVPAVGSQGVAIKVTPMRAVAPASVRVVARIEPNLANRSLAIIADGENFYRSTEIPLDGEQAPKLVDMVFENLPGGEYQIVAVLTDAGGRQRAMARETASIVAANIR